MRYVLICPCAAFCYGLTSALAAVAYHEHPEAGLWPTRLYDEVVAEVLVEAATAARARL